MSRPLSGTQYEIVGGRYEAAIASIGASLRSLRRDGHDLVVPFAAVEARPALRGAVLAPWPNRLADGSYMFGGERHRLPITEPQTGTAAHGLAAWLDFDLVERDDGILVLAALLEPRPGYPWLVEVSVRFELGPDGFGQTISATNRSDSPAPVGLGAHPYVLAGDIGESAVDGWILRSPATEVLLVSDDRLLPVGSSDVAEHDSGAFDFRSPRRIGGSILNHAFTGLAPDADGALSVTLAGAEGRGVEVSWSADAPWVQLYTADHQPGSARRHALAVEPMTCPPDAFNSGRDLRVIGPGESTSLAWRLRAL